MLRPPLQDLADLVRLHADALCSIYSDSGAVRSSGRCDDYVYRGVLSLLRAQTLSVRPHFLLADGIWGYSHIERAVSHNFVCLS